MRIPDHVGIIPDGNRRWAVKNGMEKKDGYVYGLRAGLEILEHLQELGVPEITYYGFTVDNCKRPKDQVASFSDACVEAVEMIGRRRLSLLVLGNTRSKCFPEALLPYTIPRSQREERAGLTRVNFLVNYGPEWDVSNHASVEIPPIQLVLRWGGRRRLSGFLPMQTVYADLYVTDILWPDYDSEQLVDAMEWYQHQDPTKGG